MKKNILKAGEIFLLFTLICGFIYTAVLFGLGQLIFPYQANGSIIEVNGKKVGTELMAQPFSSPEHMWGRVMILDTDTFQDKDGNPLLYSGPTNYSPLSDEIKKQVAERVELLKTYQPENLKSAPIPVDLVTCSGSGLDPDISPAAAEYQIPRLVAHTHKTEAEIRAIIAKCTTGRFLGLFGEPRVNVLKVNLMLDGVLGK